MSRRLTIYAAENVDEFTFARLRDIAAGCGVNLRRGRRNGFYFGELTQTERLDTLRVVDELYTIKKAIDRLRNVRPTHADRQRHT